MKPPYGTGKLTETGIGIILAEFARIDLGLATFMTLNWGLVLTTLELLGSEE